MVLVCIMASFLSHGRINTPEIKQNLITVVTLHELVQMYHHIEHCNDITKVFRLKNQLSIAALTIMWLDFKTTIKSTKL